MPSKTTAVIQSNYIPWKGYFDILDSVDAFVLFDECQYTRRDWRNRNQIKTPQGLAWLTIPTRNKGLRHAPIHEVEIDGWSWIDKHLRSFNHHYAKAPFFKDIWPKVEAMFNACRQEVMLSAVNHLLIRRTCGLLGIDTPLFWSHDTTKTQSDPTMRIVEICQAHNTTTYLSGPKAKEYLDVSKFSAHGIEVVWMSYDNYPEYPQPHPPFCHNVTVLDVLFNLGRERARDHVCHFKKQMCSTRKKRS